MSETAFDRVIDALESAGHQVVGSGRQRTARCPAHDDRAPSLSVTEGESRVLLNCHAGCDTDAVLAELKLTRADLFDAPLQRNGNGFEILESYQYLDESGRLLFRVHRCAADGARKTFRQQLPNGAWKLGDVRRVIYRLPAVIEALGRGDTVYIAEGERDVHALEAAGVVATTNPGGASKWRDEYSPVFAGHNVIVVADRDEPGRKHAEQVRKSLTAAGTTVRVVEAVVGKDAADHLGAGRTIGEFVSVAGATAEVAASSVRRLVPVLASSIKPRRVRWLWDCRIVLGGLTLLAGREGLGKSTVAADLAAQLTRGELDGEFHGQQRHVVYITSEDAREYTVVPRMIAAGADLNRIIFIDVHQGTSTSSPVVLPLDLELLAELIDEFKVGLVVLDAATSVMDGRLDGDRDRQMRQALEPVARMAEKADCAVLGIVHFGKRDSADTGKLILGSIAWSQVARSVMAVASDEETGNLVISNTKANLSPGDTPSLSAVIKEATVEIEGDEPAKVGRVFWLGETEQDARELLDGGGTEETKSELDEAVDWLKGYLEDRNQGGAAPAGEILKIAKRDGIAERTLQRARKTIKVKTSKGISGWTWSLADAVPNQGANTQQPDCKAPTGNAATSEDAKAPTHMHVHEPWRLGALAPCAVNGTTDSAGQMHLVPAPTRSPEDSLPWPTCACGNDIYDRSGSRTVCARCAGKDVS